MTGQFRDAAARFSAEVRAALTRARRASGEAKARSAQFRRGTEDLAEQAKSGRLRDLYADEAAPTSEKARTDATTFRAATGLPVEEYPDAEDLVAGLPDRPDPVEVDDDDFSQHQILNDIDDHDDRENGSPERDAEPDTTQSSDDPAVPSQQRIPLLGDADAFRDDDLPTILDDLAPPRNPS
jgi:hypothetical protein